MKRFRVLKTIIIISALTGLAASLIILFQYYQIRSETKLNNIIVNITELFCGSITGVSNCQKVSFSKFSTIFGLPIAAISIFIFLSLLGLSIKLVIDKQDKSEVTRAFYYNLIILISAVSLLLLIINALIIKAFNPLYAIIYISSWTGLTAYFLLFNSGNNLLEFFRNEIINITNAIEVKKIFDLSFTAAICIVSLAISILINNAMISEKIRIIDNTKRDKDIETAAKVFHSKAVKFKAVPILAAGNTSAPVEIVEFSDFMCPACSKTGMLLENYVNSRKDKVKLLFMNLPLDNKCNKNMNFQLHDGACDIALGAFAAAKQNKFGNYYIAAFSGKNYSTAKEIAFAASMDMKKFEDDMKNPELIKMLNSHLDEATTHGINSTPTIFVGGKKFNHAIDEDVLDLIIEEEIKTLPLKKYLGQ